MKAKLKPYLLTIIVVLAILTIIFILKGIYPFGNNSLIWGDMHDQITPFYYYLYDCIKGNESLLVNYSTAMGMNFFGVIAYYILSPFSLLILLFEREKIYLAVSIIIGLKILCSSLTCLYFIRLNYRKTPFILSILLAISYAFSAYSLIMYQITPWIDAMYLLPLIMVGLKKVLDLEKPTLYIVTLTLSLIFSFYVSLMVIIFIFLVSLIYLYVYQEDKKKRKQAILSLGLTTVLTLLISSFIIIPTYMQISSSARLNSTIHSLLNSKTGPITDKISILLFGVLAYAGIFFLLKNYKKNKKFLSFYIPTLIILLLPIIIEPINKVWHFGSYASFPYRFGFITAFFIIIGSLEGFSNYKNTGKEIKYSKFMSIIITIISTVLISFIYYYKYNSFQYSINKLTISNNKILILLLMTTFIISVISIIIIIILNKKLNKLTLVLTSVIAITHIMCSAMIYMGIDSDQTKLTSQYKDLNEIGKVYDKDIYYVKNEESSFITNSGMIMKYNSMSSFTSLSNNTTLLSLKKLGYSSYWMMMSSKGGNLFLDTVLGNKYLVTKDNFDDSHYEYVDKYGNLNFYKLKANIPYGYLLNKNDTIFDKANSFEISNSIYKNITDSNEKIFTIYDNYTLNNAKMNNNLLTIIDKKESSNISFDLHIDSSSTLYLELFNSLLYYENYDFYGKVDVYINDELYQKDAFSKMDNGVLKLGVYNDSDVSVKIVLKDDIPVTNITLGVLDNNKYDSFTSSKKISPNIRFDKNKIYIKVEADSDNKILFLPINYSSNYKISSNNNASIEKTYDNFIGINLSKGDNEIVLTYQIKELTITFIISLISLIFTIVLLKTNLYNHIISNDLLSKITYNIYLLIYGILIFTVYICLSLSFIISYIIYI